MAPYDPPLNRHYSQLNVSDYDEGLILSMIGRGGKGFYSITDYLGIDYLWYNSEKQIIELWGSFGALKNGATDKLKELIELHADVRES